MSIYGSAQIQIGTTLFGEEYTGGNSDGFASAISLSANGNILAIGSNGHGENNASYGRVQIFSNENGTWTQMGEDLIGTTIRKSLGNSVALNDAGDVLVVSAFDALSADSVGEIYVYNKTENDTWEEIARFDDGASFEGFGRKVSINGKGNVIAVSAWGEFGGSGFVNIYRPDASKQWQQIGQRIYGEQAFEDFGTSIDLNDEGNIIAIGGPFKDVNGNNARGYVKVYENINDQWVQIGRSIEGKEDEEESGHAVSLNAEGNILAIGAPLNKETVDNGIARVYKRQSNDSWEQIGQGIIGDSGDFIGQSVSLNDDGNILAIGGMFADNNGQDKGVAKLYKNINNAWQLIGLPIYGDNNLDYSGASINLSDDGTHIAIGGTNIDFNLTTIGHARVFTLDNILGVDNNNIDLNLNIYPNPEKDKLSISSNSKLNLQKAIIYDVGGRLISQFKLHNNNNTFDISELSAGTYFLSVYANNGHKTFKWTKE